jgi:type IV pilus assembly protein PilA
MKIILIIAIIGMMASIIVMEYQQFSIRANVSEGISVAAAAKSAVAENAFDGLAFASNWIQPKPTDNVASVSIDEATGEITVTYTDKVVPSDANTLIFSPRVGSATGARLHGTNSYSTPLNGELPIYWNCNSADQDATVSYGTLGTVWGINTPPSCHNSSPTGFWRWYFRLLKINLRTLIKK